MRSIHAVERRVCGKKGQLGRMNCAHGRYGCWRVMVYYSRTFISTDVMPYRNPSPEEICRILREVHSIAIVGLSPNEARPSHRVARGLQSFGYRIIPVRPLVNEVLGEMAFPDLESLPELPDIVDVFRASGHVPAIVESCIKLGIRNLWLQEGVIHEEAAQHAREAGITVVMDRCMWRDYMQFCEH
jgi:predicted CoA-binding protein